jgi:hypothetical protein
VGGSEDGGEVIVKTAGTEGGRKKCLFQVETCLETGALGCYTYGVEDVDPVSKSPRYRRGLAQ